MTAYRQTPER